MRAPAPAQALAAESERGGNFTNQQGQQANHACHATGTLGVAGLAPVTVNGTAQAPGMRLGVLHLCRTRYEPPPAGGGRRERRSLECLFMPTHTEIHILLFSCACWNMQRLRTVTSQKQITPRGQGFTFVPLDRRIHFRQRRLIRYRTRVRWLAPPVVARDKARDSDHRPRLAWSSKSRADEP